MVRRVLSDAATFGIFRLFPIFPNVGTRKGKTLIPQVAIITANDSEEEISAAKIFRFNSRNGMVIIAINPHNGTRSNFG